jgi:hypothetical protein
MFGCEHGAATSRTGLQRLRADHPRRPSRDEDGPIGAYRAFKMQPGRSGEFTVDKILAAFHVDLPCYILQMECGRDKLPKR